MVFMGWAVCTHPQMHAVHRHTPACDSIPVLNLNSWTVIQNYLYINNIIIIILPPSIHLSQSMKIMRLGGNPYTSQTIFLIPKVWEREWRSKVRASVWLCLMTLLSRGMSNYCFNWYQITHGYRSLNTALLRWSSGRMMVCNVALECNFLIIFGICSHHRGNYWFYRAVICCQWGSWGYWGVSLLARVFHQAIYCDHIYQGGYCKR